MSNSPQHSGGYLPPEGEPERDPEKESREESRLDTERFRRTTPARLRPIPPRRSSGYWRLVTGATTYVMVVGGMADYSEPQTRAAAHVLFWLLILAAMLVTVSREHKHGWDPGPRWPYAAAALGGAVLVELLVLLVGSPTIIVGSVILLGFASFVLMLAG
ncbi:hypothetical protein [Nocardiopsis kunsanensis]|uniref:Uncharacterized protein n=1 Tax=Nocardiopsis kunsanensis TaxID=141693 RepID=A0A919CJW7_9ACTN|nr:hypothetical protein [Nocardiopsis kunsanensis]GHD30958.1 hypothetical protein GCM10007147_33280 [Nocardiopsis kunsanensis]